MVLDQLVEVRLQPWLGHKLAIEAAQWTPFFYKIRGRIIIRPTGIRASQSYIEAARGWTRSREACAFVIVCMGAACDRECVLKSIAGSKSNVAIQ